jgi:hypothetical protein
MRTLLTALLAVTAGVAAAGEQVDASVGSLPCIPVATYWVGPPQSPGVPQGPDLAVVSTDIRPKDTQIVLDGRFIGRARYFDGTPGYLYLEPGSYTLELRMGGYTTKVFEVEAEAGCRFTLKHRMDREKGTPKESVNDPPGKGKPLYRVFAPRTETDAPKPPAGAARGGPDVSLRGDLGSEDHRPAATGEETASLRLVVNPSSAKVYLDGSLVATGLELQSMVGPLAVSSGEHLIEVQAPGFLTAKRHVDLETGEILKLTIDLETGPDRP